jgi:hypothetical protein
VKKRTRKDILEKAAPNLFGDKTIETKKNYVEFPVSFELWQQIRKWLDANDNLSIATVGKDKELRLAVINEREQKLYGERGFEGN